MISVKSRGRQLFLVILLTSNDKTLEEPYINKTPEDWLIVFWKAFTIGQNRLNVHVKYSLSFDQLC